MWVAFSLSLSHIPTSQTFRDLRSHVNSKISQLLESEPDRSEQIYNEIRILSVELDSIVMCRLVGDSDPMTNSTDGLDSSRNRRATPPVTLSTSTSIDEEISDSCSPTVSVAVSRPSRVLPTMSNQPSHTEAKNLECPSHNDNFLEAPPDTTSALASHAVTTIPEYSSHIQNFLQSPPTTTSAPHSSNGLDIDQSSCDQELPSLYPTTGSWGGEGTGGGE
jgi:hypothetical protein